MLPLSILVIENEDDRTFITEVYLQNKHPMYCMIKKMIHNEHDIEDIINEVIICLIRNIATIRNLNSFSLRKYVMSSTKTTTLNYLAKKKVKSQFEFVPLDNTLESIPSEQENVVDGVLIQLESIQQLKDALKSLPQYEYDILFMREYDGLTDSEIAIILGKKENSIRSYASRAYRHAREILASC